jgi:hypothetical protein
VFSSVTEKPSKVESPVSSRTPNGLKAQGSCGLPQQAAAPRWPIDHFEVLNGGCAPDVDEVLGGTASVGRDYLVCGVTGETVLYGESLSNPVPVPCSA